MDATPLLSPNVDEATSASLFEGVTLPTPPGVALEILRLADDDTAGASDLADVIAHDAAITSRLLRLVNSPLYGLPGSVDTVTRAVTVLGFRQVRLLALAFSITDAVPDVDPAVGFDFPAFWLRSLVTASAAKVVARRACPGLQDTAFVAGLLAPLGRPILATMRPDPYRELLAEHPWPTPEQEEAAVGVSSATVCGVLLANWSLPETLVLSARHHPGPDLLPAGTDDTSAVVTRVVAFSALVAEAASSPDIEFDDLLDAGRRWLGFDRDAVEETLAAVMDRIMESGQLVAADLPPGTTAEDLMDRARTTISRLLEAQVKVQ